jgi:peptide/nickel transport system permease protein
MKAYFLKRLILLIVTLWGITLVSFGILQLAPGSPIDAKLGAGSESSLSDRSGITEQQRLQLMQEFNLDKPLLVQYGLWLGKLVRLDMGTSFIDRRPVAEKIAERIPVSLIFGLSALFFALVIGIPLGLLAGSRPNSFFDRLIAVKVIALYSLPTYVLGILLITFFGGGDFLDLFPIYGIQSDNYSQFVWWERILDRAHHFILPCLCYSLGTLAFITQQQRASILEVMNQDYIRTARAKGVSERWVLLKHGFRNSLIPIVTLLGAMIPSILGGGVIVESMFSIPGLGLLAFESLLQRDYPVIMANFTIVAFLSLLGIFLSDLFYVLVDPRISFEGRD